MQFNNVYWNKIICSPPPLKSFTRSGTRLSKVKESMTCENNESVLYIEKECPLSAIKTLQVPTEKKVKRNRKILHYVFLGFYLISCKI